MTTLAQKQAIQKISEKYPELTFKRGEDNILYIYRKNENEEPIELLNTQIIALLPDMIKESYPAKEVSKKVLYSIAIVSLNPIAKASESKGPRILKYEYPEGLSKAQKKVFRRNARKESKKAALLAQLPNPELLKPAEKGEKTAKKKK